MSKVAERVAVFGSMEAEIVNSLCSLLVGAGATSGRRGSILSHESCRTVQTDGGPGSEDLWSDARDEQITGAGAWGSGGRVAVVATLLNAWAIKLIALAANSAPP